MRPRHGPAGRRTDHDDGVATVWAATAVAVVLVTAAVGVDIGAAVRARHVAATAADVAALAAAGRAVDGTDTACGVAAEVAARNGAQLTTCRLDGWDALVETRIDRSGLLPVPSPATARARAGPAPPPGAPTSTTPTAGGTVTPATMNGT